jgi:anti-sigma B factor antagonist
MGLERNHVSLTVSERVVGDVTILRCEGRLVAGSEADCLRERISVVLLERRDIALHLGDVSFIDSSGLGMLVRLLTTSRRMGGDLKLCQVPDNILRILKMTNLTQVFDVHGSEESAVAAAYQRRTSGEQMSSGGATVLCVDQSNDVLACVREILRSAGYNAVTSNNLHDSLILARAMRPTFLVLGPSLGGSAGTQRAFRDACSALQVIELGEQFSTQDAGQAATDLLSKIDSCRQMRAGSLS